MTLRTGIFLIRFLTVIAFAIAVAAYVIYFAALKNPVYLAVSCLLVLVAAIISLSKRAWVRYMFRKINYPGILYGVCDDLALLRNSAVNPSDAILDDLYRPAYDTETFLQDNALSNYVYAASNGYLLFKSVFVFMLPCVIVTVGFKSRNFSTLQVACVAGASAATGIIGGYLLRKRGATSGDPKYIFTAEGLSCVDKKDTVLIKWGNVYSWQLVPGKGRGESSYIEISTNDPLSGQEVHAISLDEIAISYVDMFILLTHYKYKYGYTAATS